MINTEIRKQVFESEITYKQIAAAMGVSHEHLCRMMARELSEKNRLRILKAIDQVRIG